MGRKRKCTQISKILIYFWKTFRDIFFVFFFSTCNQLFIFLLLQVPPSPPPPSECLCTGWHLRALAGIKISGSLKSGPGAQADRYLLTGVPGHSYPGAQGATENCIFAIRIYFLKNHNRILYTNMSAVAHTHTHTHTHTKLWVKSTIISFILICSSAVSSKNIVIRNTPPKNKRDKHPYYSSCIFEMCLCRGDWNIS